MDKQDTPLAWLTHRSHCGLCHPDTSEGREDDRLEGTGQETRPHKDCTENKRTEGRWDVCVQTDKPTLEQMVQEEGV